MKRSGASIGVDVLAACAVMLGYCGATSSAWAQSTDAVALTDEFVAIEANDLSEERSPRRIIANGEVEAKYDGRVLRADRVVYDLDAKSVRASGNVQITDSDGSIRFAEEVEVDDKLQDGVATNFASSLPGNATVIANSAIRKQGDKTMLGQVIYTACPICDAKGEPKRPTWTLRARRATQNQHTKMISYRDAVIEMRGVPIVYLPYFTHVDPTSGQRSGLLPPGIGQSSSLGFTYEQPYYWSISPSQDLVLAPQFSTNVSPSLGTKYRKRFYSGELEIAGSVTDEQEFTSNGDKFGEKKLRGHGFARGVWDINDKWRWGFGIEEVSDDLYTIRYKTDGEDRVRGPFQTRPYSLIDQVYTERRTQDSSAIISAMKFNDLTIANDREVLPRVLPYVSYLQRIPDPIAGGQFTLDVNAAALTRSGAGTDSQRTSVNLSWARRQMVGPGILIEPFAETRADYFQVSAPSKSIEDASFGRSYGSVGTVARWPLRRAGKVDLIIEPIAMIAVGSENPNDLRIQNEDSPSFELDETSLFRGNSAPNYDLIEGGTRASVGVRVSAQTSSGFDGSAFIGRRWRSKADTTFTDASNLGKTASDYVAAMETNFAQRFRLNLRMRLDGDDLTVKRIDGGASTFVGPLTVGARYYKFDKSLVTANSPAEQLQLSSSLKLRKNLRLDYSMTRDIPTDVTLTQRLGLIFNDNCTTLGLFYNRSETQNRQIGPSEGFVFQFTLATLGSFGRDSLTDQR